MTRLGDEFSITKLHRILGFELSDEQLAAVTADLDRPLLVVAGAGSGKTTVMAARVLWAVGTGQVAPDQVVGLTFTRKAAAELGGRVRSYLDVLFEDYPPTSLADGEAGSPLVSTYHSFARQFVAEHGLRIGVEPGARLLSDAQTLQLAYRVVLNTSAPLTDMGVGAPALADVVAKLDQQLSEHVTTPAQLRAHEQDLIERIDGLEKTVDPDRQLRLTASRRFQLCDVVEEFRREKSAECVVDFADVLRFGHELAAREDVQNVFHEQVKMVLLDEYQDTSVVQAELLAPLVGPAGSVTAVGDPLQAIYGWRGAGANAMTDFLRHFGDQGSSRASVLPLSISQRSGHNILGVANAIAEPMRAESTQVVTLRPGVDAEGNIRRDGIRVAAFETYREELSWLADRIAEQIEAGTEPSRMAVLCRAGADFAAVLDALHAKGIAAVVSGTDGLLAQPEVIDVVSILKVVGDPTDNPAMLRILVGPRMRIGTRDLALLGRRAFDLAREAGLPRKEQRAGVDFTESIRGTDTADLVSLAEAIDDLGPSETYPYSAQARDRLIRLSRELAEVRGAVSLPLPDLVSRVIGLIGLDVEARLEAASGRGRNAMSPQRGIAAIQALHELVNAADQSIEDRSLAGFLSWISVIQRVNREPEFEIPTPANAVQVMTVHKAKGLEWDVVAVPFMSASVFPSGRSRDRWTSNVGELPHSLRGDRDSLPLLVGFGTQAHAAFNDGVKALSAAEERRLGYVAVTRPTRLLLASGHWWGPTQTKPRGPSDLLAIIRERCAEPANDDPWVSQTVHESNPQANASVDATWPPDLGGDGRERRKGAASLVTEAAAGSLPVTAALDDLDQITVDDWDQDIEMLLAERGFRSASTDRRLPRTMSASDFMAVHKDSESFLARRARPMPQRPSAAALRGTRFHTWVEEHLGQRPLFEELPGAADDELFTEEELAELRRGFLQTSYADRVPYAVEVPFSIVLDGLVLKGRIDAVYRDGAHWEMVDWKTNVAATADPLQLAIYRYAWSQMMRVPIESIDGVFVYVRTSEVIRYDALPDLPTLGVRP